MRLRGQFGTLSLLALAGVLLLTGPAHANLVFNGDFEIGPAPGDAIMLSTGSTEISGWTVTGSNIDYCGTRWTAVSGTRSVALNGTDTGGIAQAFDTLPHGEYSVAFWLCGDPFSSPVVKQIRLSAAGQNGDFSFDTSGMWPWDPGWNPYQWTFTAASTRTTLEFHSLMTGDTGPAIDSIVVTLTSVAGVDASLPATFALAPIAPNPMRDAGRIAFTVPRESDVRLDVIDLQGRVVATLAQGAFAAGRYERTWNGEGAGGRAAAGVYFARLRAPGRTLVQRVVRLQP